jgi:hypothetical protein
VLAQLQLRDCTVRLMRDVEGIVSAITNVRVFFSSGLHCPTPILISISLCFWPIQTHDGSIRPRSAPSRSSQARTVFGYYGAFLDVCDTKYQTTTPGTHYCLVTQSGSKLVKPIPIMTSGNPSPKPTHRILQAAEPRTDRQVG